MSITNGDFSTPDGTIGPGRADSWTVTINAAEELYAEFATDPGAVPTLESTNGQEEFETGWTPPVDQAPFIADFSGGYYVDLYPAFFDDDPKDNEDFENEWSIVAGQSHNGIATLAAAAQALFDSVNPEDVEDMEEGWNSPGDVLIPSFAPADLSFASFDPGTPESVEDFEEEWGGNESYVAAFVGYGTDLEAAFFNEPGPSLIQVERFFGTRFEVSGVIVDPTGDTFNDGGGNFLTGERVQFRVENGSLPSPVQSSPTLYYARNVSSPTFQISEQAASAIIDITSAGTGVLFVKGDPALFWVDELTGV